MKSLDWRESIVTALDDRNNTQYELHSQLITSYNKLLESNERYKIICNHQQVELDRLRNNGVHAGVFSTSAPSGESKELLNIQEQLKTSKNELLNVYREQQQTAKQLEEMKSMMKTKEADVMALKEALKKADEMNILLKKKNELVEQNIVEVEMANQCFKDELTALQMAYASLEARCSSLESQNTQLIKEIVDNKQKIAEFLDKEVEDDIQKRRRNDRMMLEQATEEFVSIVVPSEKLKTQASSCMLPSKPLHTTMAHDGEVTCVAWNSRRLLATGGADRKVRVWDVSNGKLEGRFVLSGNNAGVTSVCFEYEGGLLLASSNDYACRVWSINDQRLKSTLTGHGGSVLSAKFMMDSNRVVSGGKDRVVKLWDLKNIACINSLFIGSMCIDLAVISSTTFVSGHFDSSLRFWDCRSDSTKEHQLISLSGKVSSLDISADGKYILANTRDQVLNIVDTRMPASVVLNFQEEGFHNTYDYNKAVFSPDGNYIAAGSTDGEIYIWNLKSQKLETKVKSKDATYAVAWSNTGCEFVSCSKAKSIVLWACI